MLGRLFQVWAAVTGKVRSLTVDSRVGRTFSDSEEAERSREVSLGLEHGDSGLAYNKY